MAQLSFDLPPVLYLAGYQGRTPDAFVRLLEKHGITQVIDVREFPVSRRPGFTKKALAAVLEKAGVAYVHVREAGNPFRHSPEEPGAPAFDRYAEYLDQHPEAVEAVAAAAKTGLSVLLCFERSAEECHRSVLGARVAAKLGVPVESI